VSAVHLVANPTAGDGAGLQLARRVEAALVATGRRVETMTTADLHTRGVALAGTPHGAGCVLCVGGDSTLSKVASVLPPRMPLAAVPTGFGNLFARCFGHRADEASVLRLLERGTTVWVDAGADGRELFLSNRGFGFLEDVKRAVEHATRRPRPSLARYLAYVRVAVRHALAPSLPAFAVDVDGDRLVDQAAIVIVANLPTYAGFLPLAPSASPFDGLVDVVAVPVMSRPALVGLLLAFLLRLPGRNRGARHRRATHVRILGPGREASRLEAVGHAVPVLVEPDVAARLGAASRRLAPRD
jgi:diacylglycerol kinase family enzyme